MAQARSLEGECWGHLTKTGWDGSRHRVTGLCLKKAQAGKLTCWCHRFQESEAVSIKKKIEEAKALPKS